MPLDGDPAPLTSGETTLSAVAVAGGNVVATLTDDAYPPEVCAVEAGPARRLSRHGGTWLRRHPAPTVRGGRRRRRARVPVRAAGANGRSALVLTPHGGPYGAHAPTPELDTWALVSRGYRSRPNIRGSCGYGRDWGGGAIRNRNQGTT